MDTLWGKFEDETLASAGPEGDDIYVRNNEIHFNGPVNRKTISHFIKCIQQVLDTYTISTNNYTQPKEVIYYIDSEGGFLSAMFKFVDYIRMLQSQNVKFTSIIHGNAHSAASIMALVADIRKITKYSGAMIHDVKAGPGIQFSANLDAYNTYIQARQKHLEGIYLDKSLADRDSLKKLMSVETYFDAEEYKKYGFVDEIIG